MNKFFIVGLVAALLLLGGVLAITRIPGVQKQAVPKAGFIPGTSNAITQLPERGKATSMIIDFAKCGRGSDTVAFGLGSTRFAFEGINNGQCLYYFGTEIENPEWDGTLQYKCNVPTSLGQKSFGVGYMGIQMEALNQYCASL